MNPWKIKYRRECPDCSGVGELGGADIISDPPISCGHCDGTGNVTVELDPENIELFSDRPESKEFRCVCGKPESILRPLLGQIPHSWMQWGEDLVCGDCKLKVLLSCAMSAAEKIQQIKESKRGEVQ